MQLVTDENCTKVATLSREGRLKLWNIQTGRAELDVSVEMNGGPYYMQFFMNDRRLVLWWLNSVKVFDITTEGKGGVVWDDDTGIVAIQYSDSLAALKV